MIPEICYVNGISILEYFGIDYEESFNVQSEGLKPKAEDYNNPVLEGLSQSKKERIVEEIYKTADRIRNYYNHYRKGEIDKENWEWNIEDESKELARFLRVVIGKENLPKSIVENFGDFLY